MSGFRQKGIAAVEMAILIIPLVLVLWGITELGRAHYYYNTLLKATRDAARYLSVKTQGDAVAEATAKNLAVCGTTNACAESERLALSLNTDNVAISYDTIPGPPAVAIVTVTIHGYGYVPLFMAPVFSGTAPGAAFTFGNVSATMRRGAG